MYQILATLDSFNYETLQIPYNSTLSDIKLQVRFIWKIAIRFRIYLDWQIILNLIYILMITD